MAMGRKYSPLCIRDVSYYFIMLLVVLVVFNNEDENDDDPMHWPYT